MKHGISRELADQVGDKLQVIVDFIESEKKSEAIRAVQELARFLNQKIEVITSPTK